MAAAWLTLLLAATPVAWRTVAPGAEHLRVDDVELVRFDLGRFKAEVAVRGADRAVTAAALREELAALAVVNGGFFDTEWRPLGLRIAGGRVLVGLRPRVDWGVLVVSGGQAHIVHSREFRPNSAGTAGIDAAIQVGPRWVAAGRAFKLKPQSARRTAVALDRGGRKITLAVTRSEVSAQDLAALLVRLGFDSALMLDGGPSSQLSAAIGDFHLDLRGGYGVPDALVVRAR